MYPWLWRRFVKSCRNTGAYNQVTLVRNPISSKIPVFHGNPLVLKTLPHRRPVPSQDPFHLNVGVNGEENPEIENILPQRMHTVYALHDSKPFRNNTDRICQRLPMTVIDLIPELPVPFQMIRLTEEASVEKYPDEFRMVVYDYFYLHLRMCLLKFCYITRQ